MSVPPAHSSDPDPAPAAEATPVAEATHLADGTLGGYTRTHDRPPAFEGSDGHPYTVSQEVERTDDLREPWVGYLVYPRWAENGVGIIGHLESPTLVQGRSEEEVRNGLERLALTEVFAALETAIAARGEA